MRGLAFAGFLALAAYVIPRGGDRSALTERITLTVIDPQEKYETCGQESIVSGSVLEGTPRSAP